ncbi:hypothetical protein [Actinoplanes sp. NPDC051859]|uniref:hypothetical protein n=1 Tax=Actinoplanes sp. NPDC051859 TaxID=3363909 RepID=UPI0037A8898E
MTAAIGLAVTTGTIAAATPAQAIPANIHISGTDGQGVRMRPDPNTSRTAVGNIPEGASPDYDCFTYGEMIGNVNVWFLVNWNGTRGYYASFYDDSHYSSEADLTSRYGIPKCGQPSQGGLPAGSTIYTVMNTSEEPPDGVWFRNSPHTNDTDRVTGLGVYQNERVRAICWADGDAVGRYGNRIWYNAENLSRATAGGRTNAGFLNTHYVDDGMSAGHPAPGVPKCGVSSIPSSPEPKAIAGYYSPYGPGDKLLRDRTGVHSVSMGNWNRWDSCPQLSDWPYYALDGQLGRNEFYDRVGGWSYGRLGPAFLIQHMKSYDMNELRLLDYVILIDPGNADDLTPCDARNGSGDLYAFWLKYNTRARLVVLSGKITQQNSSRGIQRNYFNQIRAQATGNNIRNRVLVCNYSADHHQMYDAGQYWIKNKIGSTCPTLNYGGRRWTGRGWNP